MIGLICLFLPSFFLRTDIMFRRHVQKSRRGPTPAAEQRAPSDNVITIDDSSDDDDVLGRRSRHRAAPAVAVAVAASARAATSAVSNVLDVRSLDATSGRVHGRAPVAATASHGDDAMDVRSPSPSARSSRTVFAAATAATAAASENVIDLNTPISSNNKRGSTAGSSSRPRFLPRNTNTPDTMKRLGGVLSPLVGGNNKQQSSPKKKSPLERGADLTTKLKEKVKPSKGDLDTRNIVQRYRDCKTIPRELQSKYGDIIRDSLEGSTEKASIESILQTKTPPVEFFTPDSLSRNPRKNALVTMTGNFASLDPRYDDRALENRDGNGELGPFFKEIFGVLVETAV